jgi:2-hydroxychromene-2-carboxylate isomerase
MKQLCFHFDLVSPYAFLAFHRLPQALQGQSYSVAYRPVLFGALLKHWGQLGPAEVEPKRDWTYRQIAWAAHRLGVDMRMPAVHPFNPLMLLRVLLAHGSMSGTPGQTSRWACERAFAQVWQTGADPQQADAAGRLAAELHADDPAALLAHAQTEEVKSLLRDNTERAIAGGVFGVPTIEVDGRHFWGLDSLDMLAACLGGDPWFDGPQWTEAGRVPWGIKRR